MIAIRSPRSPRCWCRPRCSTSAPTSRPSTSWSPRRRCSTRRSAGSAAPTTRSRRLRLAARRDRLRAVRFPRSTRRRGRPRRRHRPELRRPRLLAARAGVDPRRAEHAGAAAVRSQGLETSCSSRSTRSATTTPRSAATRRGQHRDTTPNLARLATGRPTSSSRSRPRPARWRRCRDHHVEVLPQRPRARRDNIKPGMPPRLKPENTLITEIFHDAGYTTARSSRTSTSPTGA